MSKTVNTRKTHLAFCNIIFIPRQLHFFSSFIHFFSWYLLTFTHNKSLFLQGTFHITSKYWLNNKACYDGCTLPFAEVLKDVMLQEGVEGYISTQLEIYMSENIHFISQQHCDITELLCLMFRLIIYKARYM